MISVFALTVVLTVTSCVFVSSVFVKKKLLNRLIKHFPRS